MSNYHFSIYTDLRKKLITRLLRKKYIKSKNTDDVLSEICKLYGKLEDIDRLREENEVLRLYHTPFWEAYLGVTFEQNEEDKAYAVPVQLAENLYTFLKCCIDEDVCTRSDDELYDIVELELGASISKMLDFWDNDTNSVASDFRNTITHIKKHPRILCDFKCAINTVSNKHDPYTVIILFNNGND